MDLRLFPLPLLLLVAACPTATTDDDASADDDTTAGDDDTTSADDDSAGDDDSSGDDDDTDPLPSILGVWDDGFGGYHGVSEVGWLTTSDFGVSRYDNTQWDMLAGWIVAQNAASNSWAAGLWSRFEWTSVEGSLWFCQVVFDAADEATALAAGPAEPSDPSVEGCGGFPWSPLVPATTAIPLLGLWNDEWGTTHQIENELWTQGAAPSASLFHLSQYDAVAGWAIAQNDETNAWSPNLWSRFDWATVGGQLYYCQTAYDAASEAAALAVPAADPSDPVNGGCAGFAWTTLEGR